MHKIKVTNLLKVVDIDQKELFGNFIAWLNQNVEPTYKDQLLKEHIYGSEILEEIEKDSVVPPMCKQYLIEIGELCRENEAGYFRIIYS